jgi:hypothetical protein
MSPHRRPHAASVTVVQVHVALEVDSDPIRGAVTTGEETAVPFTGWIELTHLLERAHQDRQ